jgi:uncharacterized membrane protein YfcA
VVQLALQTTGPARAGITLWKRFPYGWAAPPIVSLVLLGSWFRKPKRPQRRRVSFLAGLALGFAWVIGCGGGGTGAGGGAGNTVTATPQGTYTIVVTSNSNLKFDPGDGSNQFSVTTYTFTLNVK